MCETASRLRIQVRPSLHSVVHESASTIRHAVHHQGQDGDIDRGHLAEGPAEVGDAEVGHPRHEFSRPLRPFRSDFGEERCLRCREQAPLLVRNGDGRDMRRCAALGS